MTKFGRIKKRFKLGQKKLDSKKVEEEFIIYLEGNLRSDEPPTAKCTCGWSYGTDASLAALGREANIHRQTTGHRLRGM